MRCPPEGCVAKSAPRQAFAMQTSASHVSSPSDRTAHGYGSGSRTGFSGYHTKTPRRPDFGVSEMNGAPFSSPFP